MTLPHPPTPPSASSQLNGQPRETSSSPAMPAHHSTSYSPPPATSLSSSAHGSPKPPLKPGPTSNGPKFLSTASPPANHNPGNHTTRTSATRHYSKTTPHTCPSQLCRNPARSKHPPPTRLTPPHPSQWRSRTQTAPNSNPSSREDTCTPLGPGSIPRNGNRNPQPRNPPTSLVQPPAHPPTLRSQQPPAPPPPPLQPPQPTTTQAEQKDASQTREAGIGACSIEVVVS